MSYKVTFGPAARGALSERGGLPEAVAAAAYELAHGAIAADPHRIGKRLRPPMAHLHSARRGTYRILYRIDDEALAVSVRRIEHRSDV